jgi:hypothetical protein
MKSRSTRIRRARNFRSVAPELLEYRRLLATFHPLASAPDGSPQSLRAAVIAANANGQDNTIVLQGGIYKLTIPNSAGHEDAAAQGDLNLVGAKYTITIQGIGDVFPGAKNFTIIDAGGLDRAFQVASGVTAIFNDLAIEHGAAQDNGAAGSLPGQSVALGGGIFNDGTAVLNRVDIVQCSAAGGSSPDASSSAPAGLGGQSAKGGGIYNTGSLTLNQSVVENCEAVAGKGGTGAPTMDSSGSGGAGGNAEGGGIYNDGSALTLNRSTIALDTATGGDGGNGGSGLFAPGSAGGVGGSAGGGGLLTEGGRAAQITECTFAENQATAGSGGTGGSGASLATFGLNGGAGGNSGAAGGGGIEFLITTLNVDNSTVADNEVNAGSGGEGGPGGEGFKGTGAKGPPGTSNPNSTYGGGIYGGYLGYLDSVSSLIAENNGSYNSITGSYPPSDASASFTIASNTLLGDGAGADGITNGVDGNIVGVDPKIDSVGFNGGPTPTVALLPGSPAIDAGSNPFGLTTDQRGYGPRNVDRIPDIGAYELGAIAPKPVRITVKVVKVKGIQEIEVFNAGTHVLRFAVYPFGKSYRGNFQVQERDVNRDGVADVIVTRPNGRHNSVTVIYSGLDGSPLPGNLA